LRYYSSFAAEECEKVDEDHDDVGVDQYGSHHVVVHTQAVSATLDNQLGVAQQEESVDTDHKGRIEGSQPQSEAQGHDEVPHKGNSKHENHSSHDVEVDLGGESVQGHGSSDGCSAYSCQQDGLVVFSNYQYSSFVVVGRPVDALLGSEEAHAESEDEKQDVIRGDLSAHALAADDGDLAENHDEEGGNSNVPSVVVHPGLRLLAGHANANHTTSDNNLGEDDAVDFLDETVPV